jgi:regulator of protease activity HflC (stomatin/prohibitin superfamily)
MARQAEAERGKRAKIINAEGEPLAAAAPGDASGTMMAHPLARETAAATSPAPPAELLTKTIPAPTSNGVP